MMIIATLICAMFGAAIGVVVGSIAASVVVGTVVAFIVMMTSLTLCAIAISKNHKPEPIDFTTIQTQCR